MSYSYNFDRYNHDTWFPQYKTIGAYNGQTWEYNSPTLGMIYHQLDNGKIFGVQWELELVSVVEQQGMLEGMNYKTCCLPLMKYTCVYIIIV